MSAATWRDPFRLGLAAIAAVAVISLIVVGLSVATFGQRTYTAVLEHTAGLRPGENVEVHGVSVGEVSKLEVKGDQVIATFTLDKDIALGSRTTAAVKVATMLGTHYLQVEPQGRGRLAGDRIPRDRTAVPYNLQDVLEGSVKSLDELDPEKLAEAMSSVANTLDASGDEIRPALEGVAKATEVLTTRADQAGELMRMARAVTDQLADSSADMTAMMRHANLVLTEVTTRRDAISKLLEETIELSRVVQDVVASTQGDLAPALDDIASVTTFLKSEKKILDKLIDTLGPAVRYVANATGNGPWIDLNARDCLLIAADDNPLKGVCGE